MNYKILNQQVYKENIYSIVPIRYEDRLNIMNWRNEQMYHLRQNKILTIKDQDKYFDKVINELYKQKKPNQILFSFLENKQCIGYGGLVHINWIDLNAEISFVMKTDLEDSSFEFNWKLFLRLLEKVAFNELFLHKIYTYAFDIRPLLYKALEMSGFNKEAVLKDHCKFKGEFLDVVIHSKFNISNG